MDNVFFSFGKHRHLYTKNLVPGKSVYEEILIKEKGKEYRQWDPTRSKLGAAILKKIKGIELQRTDFVLYLGASTGTTVSHVSDIVEDGMVYAIEFAPRVARELVFLAERRKNIAPILADANQPRLYSHLVTEVDFLFQDVAQKNQAEIFLKNFRFLKSGGIGVLSVKSRSIDMARKPKGIYSEVKLLLEKEVKIIDYNTLEPFEKDHCVFVCRK